MYAVVITGSIATGKSTVSAYIQQLGYPLLDTDVLARVVVEPGHQGLAQLVERFGSEILQADGQLDRAALGEMLFGNPAVQAEVNAILHPLIAEEVQRGLARLEAAGEPLVFIDVPLYYETKADFPGDEVWVVYTPEAMQLERLIERNHLTEAQARSRMASQLSIEVKRTYADVVIDNSGSLTQTYQQVDEQIQRIQT